METALPPSTVSPGAAILAHELGIRRVHTTLAFNLCTARLIAIPPRFLNDPDTFWHIRTGPDICETARFPITDSYSWGRGFAPSD